jgi:ADP-ribose pyrophosphatase YjhB (NUDIX family)
MEDSGQIVVRCSAAVFRGRDVLLVQRTDLGPGDWVLPGGNPAPGETLTACVLREVAEECGLTIHDPRIAFLLEVIHPGTRNRTIDIVFTVSEPIWPQPPRPVEHDRIPRFVPVDALAELTLRPPLEHQLRQLVANDLSATAPYLGDLWQLGVDR